MINESLVKRAGISTGNLMKEAREEWEPIFFDCGGKLRPELPGANQSQRYLDYLHHYISRNPGELLSHTRRILLSLSINRPELTYGALTDLFSALGSKGTELRTGLLERCSSVLTAQQIQSLSGKFDDSDSVLFSQSIPLVIQNKSPSHQVESNVLEEAQEYLGTGQVELAQSLLEEALLKDPDNLELTAELLEIYRRSRNNEVVLRMRASLGPLGEDTRRLWDELLGSLGVSS